MKKKILIIITGNTITMKHNSPFSVVTNDKFTRHLCSFLKLEELNVIDMNKYLLTNKEN